MIGKILNHFKVLDRLGKGGMGEVYVAEDSKLKRKIALKVLPEEVARDPARLDRFQREAEAIAALNHPNIVTIYSIEEADGIRFLTMELVDGETLTQLIPSNGMDVESFLRFSAPVADALCAAHEKGIIHRDLKPANIMVSREGRIKVLDFGLAKLQRDDLDSNSSRMETHAQTQDGIVMGTMPYMSPEQIQGKRLDQRSDIFSLGIIFYEMLTGHRPFQGDTSADLISSILRDTPDPIGDLKADMPEHLERIIRHCLMKDPRDRYQTARDVYNELRDVKTTSGPSTRPRATSPSGEMWIAVLPFQHPAADPEIENFADGLVQDITAALSQFSYLSVISANSTLRLKGQSYDVRTASAQIGARYVVQGAIRKSGSLIRVNVQVMDAQGGANLWAETYNRDLQSSDIFTVQDEITDRVAATLADNFGVLVRSMVASLEDKPDDQLSANEIVFRFFGFWTTLTPEKHAQMRSILEKAVERIPKNADLWGCLSIVYGNESYNRLNELPNSLDRCLMAAKRAVALSRTSQIAHEALAWAHFLRRDLGALPAAIDRAISLNPRNSNILATLGGVLVHAGQFDRGAKLVRRAMELNPHHADWFHFPLIWDHCSRGEYEQMLERVKRINIPGFWWVPLVIASACGHLGRKSEAAAALNDLLAIDPEFGSHARESMGPLLSSSGLIDSLIEGLQKAGLQIEDSVIDGGSQQANITSSESRGVNATSGSYARPVSGEMLIAVLPFQHPAADTEIENFADGLTQDITAALSQFSYLSVSAAREQLGARYLIQGAIRKSGSSIRVNVQLIDTGTGTNLWAETYNRDLKSSDIFTIQDEITDRVAATLADQFGVLVRSMVASLEEKPDDQLSGNEFVFRFFGYWTKLTPEEHAKIRVTLERAVERIPRNADIWGCLSLVYYHEFAFGFNELPNSLDRCLMAAQRAVEINRTSQLAYEALTWAQFFRRDVAALPATVERAIALNPRNSHMLAVAGLVLVHTRNFDRGATVARRAMELNPHHAGWYHFSLIWDHYSRGEYDQTLEQAKRVNMPGFFWPPLVIASVCGELGRKAEAASAVNELLAIDPEFAVHARRYIEPWHYASGFLEPLLEGLRKAGLTTGEQAIASRIDHTSGERRADEGFWIAVLPFKCTGGKAELITLADGMTEEMVTGLSRFSYLRVIARSSTLRYAETSVDARTVGKEIGARYIMEGSLRHAGSMLRVSVQLVDANTGAHLWAETYDRTFSAENIFALQDDLVPRIVSTIADIHGILPRSMGEAVHYRSPDQMSPYEAVLRSFVYFEHVTAEEHAVAHSALELAVKKAPDYADAWAMLALVRAQDYGQGFQLLSDPLKEAAIAARRAVEVGPANHMAHFSLAEVLFFQKQFQSFRNSAERAAALNPMDAVSFALLGELLTYAGDFERGLALAARAKQLNPNHPGWYWYVDFYNAYRKGAYHDALGYLLKANMPGHWGYHAAMAATYAQLGEDTAAAKALQELLNIRPDFSATARKEAEKWWDAEYVDHFIDGLRKAGLFAKSHRPASRSDEATSVSTTEPRNSIAVLPFTNLSADPENEFFCDGLAEEMLNALAKIDQLKVAARTSTFSFKSKNAPVSEIAKALNVNTVLEGSVRKSGNRVRITAQLINAADGYHLWSERYDSEMKDIFDVQDEITLAVVKALKVKLLGQEQAFLLKRQTTNPEAHEFYLRGLAYFIRWTPEFFQKAIESFDQAIAIDPRYAAAYAGLAEAYTEMSFVSSPRESMPKAREAARKALELDDTLGDAHNCLAITKMYYDRDYAGAEQEFKRAIALDPGSAHIHMWYGWYLGLTGRFDEALKEQRHAQELDPLSDMLDFGIGAIFHWSHQPDRAIQQFQRVLELNPNRSIAYWFLAEAYVEKGDFASAIATIENAPIALNDPLTLPAVAYVYAKAGQRDKALEIVGDLQKRSGQEYEPAFHIAQIYLGLGDHGQAFAWLNKACDERSVWLIWLNVDPKFDPLRSDPRFEDLLKKIRFSH